MASIWKPLALAALLASWSVGCAHNEALDMGPEHDRPFPLGAVTDAHWETQQTNAEAADFVLYDHEFTGDTAELAPGAKRHLEQIALRLDHVPFPIVIEQSQHNREPRLDHMRRKVVIEALARMGLPNIENRVIVAPAFAEGLTSIEAQRAYQSVIGGWGNSNNFGRRFGGTGGAYR